ncbi:MAG TPA: hypothetical protein VKE40_08290 [Gemmataceae bacterium]|nr:hypothetical protein [Gemmataceae bacterium]
MKQIASILAAATVAVFCLGIPVSHQAAADPPVRSGDELAGKFLLVYTRESTGSHFALLQNVTVRRLGNRECLAGEVFLLPDGGDKWRGTIEMIPLDQIESLYVFDDRDKLIKVMSDWKSDAAGRVPPTAISATGVAEFYVPPLEISKPPAK